MKDKCETCGFQEGCTILEKAPRNYPYCHMPKPGYDAQTQKELEDFNASKAASKTKG